MGEKESERNTLKTIKGLRALLFIHCKKLLRVCFGFEVNVLGMHSAHTVISYLNQRYKRRKWIFLYFLCLFGLSLFHMRRVVFHAFFSSYPWLSFIYSSTLNRIKACHFWCGPLRCSNKTKQPAKIINVCFTIKS